MQRNKKVGGVTLNNRVISIYAPVVIGRKGEYHQLLYDMLRKGYEKAVIDGKDHKLRERILLTKNKKHSIDIFIDSIFLSEYSKNPKQFRERLTDAIERSIHESDGLVKIIYPDKTDQLISSRFVCPSCGFSFPEIEPRLFSFNSPYGACEACNGLGQVDVYIDDPCEVCDGQRLRSEALSVFLKDKKGKRYNINNVIGLSIEDASELFNTINFTKQQEEITKPLLNEIVNRVRFMKNVGLEYMTLNRKANTLSGGEAQRIRLASQLGSGLVGALYVLDEPTIGLHQRDNDRLIKTLQDLKNLGNTIIIVEHDEDTIFSSDYIVDIGPGAGKHGGKVVVSGDLEPLLTAKTNKSKSLTLSYLRGDKKIHIPTSRRKPKTHIVVKKGTANNIKDMNVEIPVGVMSVITGVSGSGKSTLLYDIIYKNFQHKLTKRLTVSKFFNTESVKGIENIKRLVLVNQSPIGRTPRSTPVTYIGAFTHIRDLFSYTEAARYRGWKPGRFSFNVPGGRCEKCNGNGSIAVEMHFLPTVFVKCDECFGKRYSKEVLDITYKHKNIHDILTMSVEEATEFFKDIPSIHDRLSTLVDVGLGYLELGQPSTTLSGGEAQRIKIASELYRPNTTNTLYLLDEPTVGLHYDDVKRLIEILNKLVDRGNTVLLIEHNLDVVKSSDYIIDIGPEAGIHGGKIVATGTPEKVIKQKGHTAKFLKKLFK